MKSVSRNVEIDIIKGIAIIMMVWTHSIAPGTKFIESFNMPVFFMLSGIFFKECNSFGDVLKFSWKKIKTLYVYYVGINVLFLLFHNIFININFYTNNTEALQYFPKLELYAPYSLKDFIKRFILVIFTVGGTQLGGATWFFRALLVSSILYAFNDFILSKLKVVNKVVFQLLIGLSFIGLSLFFSTKSIFFAGKNILIWVNQVLIAYVMFPLGKLLFKQKEIFVKNEVRLWIFFVISFVILVLPIPYKVNISRGKLYNPLILLSSTAGFILLYTISTWIAKHLSIISNGLQLLGRYTVYIVCLHLIVFKFINLVIVKSNSFQPICTAGFPSIMSLASTSTKYVTWGIVYVVLGVIVPVIIGIFYRKLKNKLLKVEK